MEILKCEHLTKVYGSGNTSIKALEQEGINFEE